MRLRRRSRYGYRSRMRVGAAPVLLVIVLVLLAGGGSVLAGAALWTDPVKTATRTLVVTEPPDVVWQLLLDLDNHPTWRRGVTRIERLPDVGGQVAWLEFHGAASRAMRIAEARPPLRLVTEVLGGGSGSTSSWAWELVPSGAGSRLTVTRQHTLTRALQRALSGLLQQTDREVERAMDDLAVRLSAAERYRTTALNR